MKRQRRNPKGECHGGWMQGAERHVVLPAVLGGAQARRRSQIGRRQITYEDYEREVARRFRNVRRAARRRVMDRVKEIVGGLLFAGIIVALMYLIAKYTPSQYSAERDRLVAEAEAQAAEGSAQ